MHRFVLQAKAAGASIGAHPGFNDLQGFGRRQIQMRPEEIEHIVAYQIGALQAIACYAGLAVTHVKAHGALGNMGMKEEAVAMAIGRAARTVDRDLIFVAHFGSQLHKAGDRLGLRVAREGYADRQYDEDGNLASRALPGTVFKDPDVAAAQAVRLAEAGEAVTRAGKVLKVAVDTICVHGDEPTAVAVATRVRAALEAKDFALKPLDRMALAEARPKAAE
jgi:UPF0271 protein